MLILQIIFGFLFFCVQGKIFLLIFFFTFLFLLFDHFPKFMLLINNFVPFDKIDIDFISLHHFQKKRMSIRNCYEEDFLFLSIFQIPRGNSPCPFGPSLLFCFVVPVLEFFALELVFVSRLIFLETEIPSPQFFFVDQQNIKKVYVLLNFVTVVRENCQHCVRWLRIRLFWIQLWIPFWERFLFIVIILQINECFVLIFKGNSIKLCYEFLEIGIFGIFQYHSLILS